MNNFFSLSTSEQQQVLQAAGARVGIPPQAIEKDLWVTTILQIVFTLPFAEKIIFKGGTSLSKVAGLINRFSEDIDLAVDRSLFDCEGDLTKKQIKKLRKASSLWVREEFCQALTQALEHYGLSPLCVVEAEQDGEGDNTYPEPRRVWVRYKSAFAESLNYLSPVVMLEIGARSLIEPHAVHHVKSIVEENFPTIQTSLVDAAIITSTPAKTFLEKVFLLHEIFSVEGRGNKADRKSRHLYDIYLMLDKPFAEEAIGNDALWESIRHHREIFTSVAEVDYTPDVRKRLVLVPPMNICAAWEADYAQMSESMIYGDIKPTFAEILAKVQILQKKFKSISFNGITQ